MEFEQIKELITLIDTSDLAFFELSDGNSHIKMDKSLSRNIVSEEKDNEVVKKELPSSQGEMNNSISVNVATDGSEIKVEEKDEDLKVINSPMVGTFYSSSSPDSKAFVSEGNEVSKGDVLCIIEAMKLMNEIESDVNGVVREILVRDGEMVEYGQPLFKVKEI